jgi:hypothetical protein
VTYHASLPAALSKKRGLTIDRATNDSTPKGAAMNDGTLQPSTAGPPPVPVGLTTKLGVAVTAALGLVAGLTAVLNGDTSTETATALGGAIATLVTVLAGRYAQAAVGVATTAPAPMLSTPLATDFDDEVEGDALPPHAEHLVAMDPAELPTDQGNGLRMAPMAVPDYQEGTS